MTALAQYFKDRYFGRQDHPYRLFEREINRVLSPDHTLLDAGCGRTAPILVQYRGRARRLIGVDLVEFDPRVQDLELYRCDLKAIPLEGNCVDVVMARSVMVSFRYLGQYPSYFMFNGLLFLLATGYEKILDKVPALAFLRGWIFATLRKPADSNA